MNNTKKQFLQGVENQSKYPSLENLVCGKQYALTISPDLESELKIFTTFNLLVETILPRFHGNIKLYTELSTKSQNVHYHGVIIWDSQLEIGKFYLDIKSLKSLCQFEIDTITDTYVWYSYIRKQSPNMDFLCHHYKVPNLIKYNYKIAYTNPMPMSCRRHA